MPPHMDNGRLLGYLIGANLASTADQPIPLLAATKYIVRGVASVRNTGTPVLAAGGVWTGPGKTGTALVPTTQLYTGLTGANVYVDLSVAGAIGTVLTAATLYFALSVANIGAATADIYVFGDTLA